MHLSLGPAPAAWLSIAFLAALTAKASAIALDPPVEPPAETAPVVPGVPDAAESPGEAADQPLFDAAAPEGWKVIQQTAKTVVLALKDSPVPVPAGRPMVVVTKSSKVFKDETVKRQSVIQFGDDLKRWTFKGQPKIDKIAVNGRPGYECTRRAVSTADESRQRVYVGKVFLDDGNLVVLGYCPDEEGADATVEAFKAITRSLKARP